MFKSPFAKRTCSIAIGAAVFVTLLAVHGCSPQSPSQEAPVDEVLTGDEGVLVRYLVPQWASSSDRRVDRQIAFQSVIDTFNSDPNGARVEEITGVVNQASVAQAIGEGAVDAVWINTQWYVSLVSGGLLADIDQYVSDEELFDYFDWTLTALRSVDGTLGCLWHNTDTPLLFYNSRRVREPPKTWTELRQIARQVRSETGKYGMSYPLRHWSQFNMGLFKAAGGDIVDDTGRPILFEGENRALLAEMLDFYAELLADDLIPAQNATASHADHLPGVYADDVYMFVSNSNAKIRSLEPNLPPNEIDDWRAAPIPMPDALDAGKYVAGGWLICPVRNAQNPEREAAAVAWAFHAPGARANTTTNKAGAWLPTRRSAYDVDPFFKSDPIQQTASSALDQGGWPEPFVPIYPTISAALNKAMSKIGSGQATTEQALNEAEAEIFRQYEAVR